MRRDSLSAPPDLLFPSGVSHVFAQLQICFGLGSSRVRSWVCFTVSWVSLEGRGLVVWWLAVAHRSAMSSSFFQTVVCVVLGGGLSLLLGGGPILAWLSISGFGSDLLRSADFMARFRCYRRGSWRLLLCLLLLPVFIPFCSFLFCIVVVSVLLCFVAVQRLVVSYLTFLRWCVSYVRKGLVCDSKTR